MTHNQNTPQKRPLDDSLCEIRRIPVPEGYSGSIEIWRYKGPTDKEWITKVVVPFIVYMDLAGVEDLRKKLDEVIRIGKEMEGEFK